MGFNTIDYNEARFAFDNVIDDLYNKKLNQFDADNRNKLKSKFERFCSCGNHININGYLRQVRCKNASCKVCSKDFARTQASALYKQCRCEDHSKYRMITCIIDVSDNIDDMFYIYDRFRKKVRDALKRKRDGKKPIALEFQSVALAGALEIDNFDMRMFEELGESKKEQYIKHFCFKMSEFQKSVWVCTFHGVVYISDLNEEYVKSVFDKASPYVHMRDLDASKSVQECIENVICYASKVEFTTSYRSGQKQKWSMHDLKSYIEYTNKFSRGRMSFKFFMEQRKNHAKNWYIAKA